jgi:hypothetical protein
MIVSKDDKEVHNSEFSINQKLEHVIQAISGKHTLYIIIILFYFHRYILQMVTIFVRL